MGRKNCCENVRAETGTQGTAEKALEKLQVSRLEAFKNTTCLVIATTGGSQTQELRGRFPQDNLILEDFIPFHEVMPLADVYVTNGGCGGVLLTIEHKLPMVVASVHEGNIEINAGWNIFNWASIRARNYPMRNKTV